MIPHFNLSKRVYGIGVKFYNSREGWTEKTYTYLYHEPIEAGAMVLVPNGEWFNVGKCMGFVEDYKQKEGIRYLNVIKKI